MLMEEYDGGLIASAYRFRMTLTQSRDHFLLQLFGKAVAECAYVAVGLYIKTLLKHIQIMFVHNHP